MATSEGPSLQRLTSFLEQDPDNLVLIAQTAEAAYDTAEMDRASDLLDRYAALAPLTPALRNLVGLVSISQRRFDDAAHVFEALLAGQPDNPNIRFNLAWCRALLGDWAQVPALLSEDIAGETPIAALLRVQALHHLDQLDAALAWGQIATERFPDDRVLHGALAIVALDAERLDVAAGYAAKGQDVPDALSTLGTLRLADNVDEALALFNRTLKIEPDNARALLGKGLGLMEQGDAPAAARYIDQGAARFGDHLGSWVAAGWAHFASGDYVASRARFETALAVDGSFAEIHGGLAVLDVMENQIESARRRVDVALRLDRQCFAAALAQSLIAAAEGDAVKADRIRAIALQTPMGPDGLTLGQEMASLSRRRTP